MRRIDELLDAARLQDASTDAFHEADEAELDLCERCGGAGFLRRRLPLGHPDFGRPVPCACVLNESAQDRQSRLLRFSNLGPLARKRFETFDLSRAANDPYLGRELRACVEEARRFSAEPRGWLAITGPSGSGKTHLAAAIANQVIDRGDVAIFMFTPDLLDHLRSSFRPDAEVSYDRLFDHVRNTPLLILDDVDAYNPTPWGREKLLQLVNHRHAEGLPTVFTLKTPVEELDERLAARLADTSLTRMLVTQRKTAERYRQVGGMGIEQVQRYTLANFDLRGAAATPDQRASLQIAHRAAVEYAESPSGWLVLLGDYGCGKTHLAAAIAGRCLEAGMAVFFAVVPDLLDHLRATFAPESGASYDEVFEQVRRAPMLVLDDLGAHSSRPWAEEKLFQIVNYRYLERLPTVITGNFRPDEIERRLSSRIWDGQLSNVLMIEAPDYRSGAVQAAPRRPRPRR
jgi:DNA replication protein DnaC